MTNPSTFSLWKREYLEYITSRMMFPEIH